ncbi:single-stranded DNA-binding protein [Candidatus Parcubacteria bacterium]|nr:single-stranded DNA-binding protein [Candidatus Parcubacteria bacterium]
MYLNKAIIIGNLTRDPELKALPSGIKVASFSLATNRTWKGADGQKKEEVQFHNIVVFGRQAETVSQYMKKGSSLLVEGRMQTRSWDGQDGKKNYRTEIVADRVQFGARAEGGSAGSSSSSSSTKEEPQQEAPEIDYPDVDINPDDIPF